MARYGWDLRIMDKLDRIRSTGVFRNANVAVVHQMVVIEHHVFEYRTKAEGLEDLRLVLGR